MYEYVKGNHVYYGDKYCGSPIREIKCCSDKEGKYWDKIEKKIRKQRNK